MPRPSFSLAGSSSVGSRGWLSLSAGGRWTGPSALWACVAVSQSGSGCDGLCYVAGVLVDSVDDPRLAGMEPREPEEIDPRNG
jgi:hypothetical protein